MRALAPVIGSIRCETVRVRRKMRGKMCLVYSEDGVERMKGVKRVAGDWLKGR